MRDHAGPRCPPAGAWRAHRAVIENTTDPREAIQANLRLATNYNRWIADQVRAHIGHRVVDAGCGAGNIAELLLDREAVIAVEVWEPFVEMLRERFAESANVTILEFDLADPALTSALADHRPDSAMCTNVLEHVEDDRAALANIALALPPGSPFFLFVPAFPSIYGAHDRADHHFRRYTKRTVEHTLRDVPLEIERQYYVNLPGYFAWLVLGRVLRRELKSGDIGLFDKLFPILLKAEKRSGAPFGQSLVSILRRKE